MIGAVLAALGGLFFLFFGAVLNGPYHGTFAQLGLFGSVQLAFAVPAFILASALLRGRTLAWAGEILLALLGMVGGVAAFSEGVQSPYPVIIIAPGVVVLYYMTRPPVRQYFRERGVSQLG